MLITILILVYLTVAALFYDILSTVRYKPLPKVEIFIVIAWPISFPLLCVYAYFAKPWS